ncbi:MAG: phosphatase PAP2 family protein [Parvibaculum sp.]
MKYHYPRLVELIVCLACLALISLSPLLVDVDHWIQAFLFRPEFKSWLVAPDERGLLHLVFYRGPKLALVLAGLGVVSWLALRSWVRGWDEESFNKALCLLAMVSIPIIVGALKGATGVSCPVQEWQYGGDYQHVAIRDQLMHWRAAADNFHCWPAGHASGGFALFALRLWHVPGARAGKGVWMWLVPGLVLGWAMGLYQMARGQHYLSHTLATMCIAWIVTSAVLLIHEHLRAAEPDGFRRL